MVQRGQDLTLGEEARPQLLRVRASAQQLDRDEAPELPVVALGEVHDAHAAAAELPVHAVRADPPHGGWWGTDRRPRV